MFRRFFSKRAGIKAVQRYLDGVAALRRGDFTSIDKLVRTDLEDIRKEILKPHSSAVDRLLRANLVLLEELQDQQGQRDQKGGSENNWSIAFPLSAFWAKLSGRFNSQSRADLARLSEQISPGVGYLSSGWLAPVGMGVTLTIAMAALFTNPAEVAKAEISPAAITRPAPEAIPASQSASTAGNSHDDAANEVGTHGVSAKVTLPTGGPSAENKVDAAIKREARRIVIRRDFEIRLNGETIAKHEGDTAYVYCDSSLREKLCDAYDAIPKPEA